MSQTHILSGGFDSPATGSAQAFRAAMEAMARPGTIETLSGGTGPAPLSDAAATLLLTLCDTTTPLFLGASHDTDDIRAWLAFHTGAPIARREDAQFALGTWSDLAPLGAYATGTPEYPDRSVTLIVEMPELSNTGAVLRGPGIEETTRLNLPDPQAHQANRALFPLGFDCFFTAGNRVAGLPRSTDVTAQPVAAEEV
ncbi:phosphonate C-P lyase system protein PhnH [Aliishimia ponticola]|uniref:Phosphonate C-P lyase system protein PhnH n=1 Tax=Aliishimia ponticola TaxID=2499833 RepID=A0A4S4NCL7_9RHOB|nr:phosphonate C-P lyase system protein PhnH [Aliishimia ponticola]THH37186.1 phosphonate C-P lyase system protein PhnH [Aliishimia ponticola]